MDIISLCFPPHTTHFLQPLDVSCFRPLTNSHKKQLEERNKHGEVYINKLDYLRFLKQACSETMTPSVIKSAWAGVGKNLHQFICDLLWKICKGEESLRGRGCKGEEGPRGRGCQGEEGPRGAESSVVNWGYPSIQNASQKGSYQAPLQNQHPSKKLTLRVGSKPPAPSSPVVEEVAKESEVI